MIIYQVLFYTTVAIVILILLKLMMVDNSSPVHTEKVVVLPASKIFYYLSIVCITIGIFFLLLPWVFPDPEDEQLMIGVASIFGLIFILAGAFLGLHYKYHRLYFDQRGVWTSNFRGKHSQLQPWPHLKEVRWNLFRGQIILLAKNGTKLKFTQYLIGLPTFIDAIEKRTPLKAKKFREYYQKMKGWHQQNPF